MSGHNPQEPTTDPWGGPLWISKKLPKGSVHKRVQSTIRVSIDEASIAYVEGHLEYLSKIEIFTVYQLYEGKKGWLVLGPSIDKRGVDVVSFVRPLFLLHVLI